MSTAQVSSQQSFIDDRAAPAEFPSPGRLMAVPAPARSDVEGHLTLVDALLTEVISELTEIWATLPDDDHGQLEILGAADIPDFISALISGGGKRLRPIMVYLGWLSCGGRSRDIGRPDIVRVSAALELLHLFALVHDDVMDESASRRGRPTVHVTAQHLHLSNAASGSGQRFGESIAILVGDLAQAEAGHLIAGLPAPMRSIWRVLVAELVAGQRRDLIGGAVGRKDLAYARTVAKMKSGRYTVGRPLELGAAAAEGSAVSSAGLGEYGQAIGEAFALRDDLLGIWGDPERTGKPVGDDLISGKPTVILALAQTRLRTAAGRRALSLVGTADFRTADLAVLMEQLRADGIDTAVEAMISGHVDRALAALDNRDLEPVGVAHLTRMAHQIAWRDR
jgi:geranylgeranyl diphosphate synthase type I